MTYLIMINDGEYINADKIESIRCYKQTDVDSEHAMVEMESGTQFRVDDVDKFFARLQYLHNADFYRGCNYVPE